MPNWVITRIYITGPEDKIKDFEAKCISLDEERVFSFDRVKKRPEELTNTKAPDPKPELRMVKDLQGKKIEIEVYQENLNDWEIQAAINRGETPPEPIPCNNATPDQQNELCLKYGTSNWYDWNIYNWGTKWDCSESTYSEEDKILDFQTAWGCPQEIIAEMAGMFPDLKFTGTFADEDFGSNTGYIEDGGTFHLENGSEEAYETAATLWNCQGYYDDERGKWIHEGEEDE